MYKISVPTIITNGHFNREKTLSELKRCNADRVALTIDRQPQYGFSSPENLALLEELIKYYQSNGLEVIVWLGEHLGHGCSVINEPDGYEHMRQFKRGDIEAFCPIGETFLKTVCSWVQKIGSFSPEMIMLDDDFRFYFREGIGCCCELHMNVIRKKLNENITEDLLYEKLWNGGKNKYRTAWLYAQGNSIKNYARRLRAALDEAAPNVRLGFCSCVSWDAEGWEPIEVTKLMAGNTKPFLRICGAPYWVKSEHKTNLGEVLELVRWESAYFENNGIEFFCEGDTYPRPRHECPASYLECYDMIIRADGKSDGILKYMLDYVSDSDYETGYIDSMLKNQELYSEIEKHFSSKPAVGVHPYITMNTLEESELSYDGTLMDRLQNARREPLFTFTSLNSIPVSYDGNGVNIIFGDHARYIPIDKLKNGSIIDIKAAKLLTERGIDVGISEFLPKEEYKLTGFSDLPSEYFIDEGTYTRLDLGVEIHSFTCDPRVKTVSEFNASGRVISRSFEYENSDGMRFLVYPFDAYEAKHSVGWLTNHARKRQIIKSVQWLGSSPLDAYIDGNFPNIYTMVKKDESSVSVGLWNLFDDKAERLKLRFAEAPKKIEFINCKGALNGNEVLISTTVYPYEFCGIIAYL